MSVERIASESELSVNRMDPHSVGRLFTQCRQEDIVFTSERPLGGFWIRPSSGDQSAKIRIVAPLDTQIRAMEQRYNSLSRVICTDGVKYTHNWPLIVDIQDDVGVTGIYQGNAIINPIRLIQDYNNQAANVKFGIRPTMGEKCILPLGDVMGKRRDRAYDALLIHKSQYSVFDSRALTDSVRDLLHKNPAIEVIGNTGFGDASFVCRMVYVEGKPLLIWVVPMGAKNDHFILHEHATSEFLPLKYSRLGVAIIARFHDDGIHISKANVTRSDSLKHEIEVCGPDEIPNIAANRVGIPYLTPSPVTEYVPMIFQGCMLRMNDRAYQAVNISEPNIYNMLRYER